MPATGGSGGPLTDRTFVAHTGSVVSGEFHCYAAGLDWTKEVGLLIYTDGSGDFGLENPTSTYLLAGTNGMINVAKRQNMVLLAILAPGAGCPDGDGVCWYQTSSGWNPTQKATWSYEVVQLVKSQYNLETDRIAFGGYSSGAQWTTEYFGPLYASLAMTDGVAVAISYGGSPKVTTAFTAAHKTAVPYSWDVGDQDPSYQDSGVYGVQAGYDWYTSNGFTTQLNVVPGLGHARSGQFGPVMEREIQEHVRAAQTLQTAPAAPSGLTASAVSSSAINLAWVDNATNETGYTVERSPNGTGSWTVLTSSLPANTTAYQSGGLVSSTAYYYRVKATNAAGSSAYSATANATTQAAPVGAGELRRKLGTAWKRYGRGDVAVAGSGPALYPAATLYPATTQYPNG